MYWSSIVGALGLLAPLVLAAPSAQLDKRLDCKFNSATDPTCWDDNFNLETNYYETGPKTGKVHTYDFVITNITVSPDGIERTALAINGQIPGPAITANWGDTIVVHVTNNIGTAGTSIHFHGVRQNNTNSQDGVVSITQCPTPGNGTTTTYTWIATQYGSSWYHSHYAVQAWDGLFGPIEIQGPASQKYDIDLGSVMLSDWTHQTSESIYNAKAHLEDGATMDNGLINGKNIFTKEDGTVVGKRHEIIFTPGKTHRIRLVNTAMDTHYNVAIDGHEMEVIAADFVSVDPFKTDILTIGIGQRYDIIVKPNAAGGNHWFRVQESQYCGFGFSLPNGLDLKAIIRYDANSKEDPAPKDAPAWENSCLDMPAANLKPSLKIDLPESNFAADHTVDFQKQQNPETSFMDWMIKEVPYYSPWDYPTLQQVAEKNTSNFDPRQQVVRVDDSKKFIYALITVNEGTPHPVHLHGHDFFILGQSKEAFDPATFVPNLKNPPRRDVAMVQSSGFLAIAFQTDNPGAWLLHCHIGWHTSNGFAMTFLEHEKLIDTNSKELKANCDAWKDWSAKAGIKQHDSGV
ncbi:multicopper oxidase [Podospora didyma]|uniref:Multicopper oxidase n=1 Tax=Podospora didyma TaxID=330526 RepID=A0AAE0TWH2_9PEZI|nr:multicopper oxidase [Podospora didyma]